MPRKRKTAAFALKVALLFLTPGLVLGALEPFAALAGPTGATPLDNSAAALTAHVTLTFEPNGQRAAFSPPAVALTKRRAPLLKFASRWQPNDFRGFKAPLLVFKSSSALSPAGFIKASHVVRSSTNHPFDRPHESETNSDRINFDSPVLAPLAFVRFCRRYPQECKVSQAVPRPGPIGLDTARGTELAEVNRNVNGMIKPQENHGDVTSEEWLLFPHLGDCNDYAVTKRHELLMRGWPMYSLLLAEVAIPSGEHHLVLIVRTEKADLILDNLNKDIQPISQSEYRWIRAQQPKNPKFWSTIRDWRAPRIAMDVQR
jgi:predicted transglutaminase-like cysteine proteinase